MDNGADRAVSDAGIVDLFFERDESALEMTRKKYAKLYMSIALSVLCLHEDAEACMNDLLLRLWNAIPPDRPVSLKAYGARVMRNIALDRAEKESAQKRGGGRLYEELSECASFDGPDQMLDDKRTGELIDAFLRNCERDHRIMFVRRYFLGESFSDLSAHFGISEGAVRTQLTRIRKKLKQYLEKEGVSL